MTEPHAQSSEMITFMASTSPYPVEVTAMLEMTAIWGGVCLPSLSPFAKPFRLGGLAS